MHLHLVTPCGRYGKCHGELFLRKRGSLEPMDTPRKYYETEAKYQEGQLLSAAAWEQWKKEKFGNAEVSRSPWFELVDQELREINNLVQSSDDEEFRLGLEKLRDRVSASENADANLTRLGGSALKEERLRFQELIRKGPPLLATILKYLESYSRREEGKEKLFNLCDDAVVSKTMRGPTVSYHPRISASTARQEGQDNMENEGRETQRAISRLNNLFPPSAAPAETSPTSRTTIRPNDSSERRHIASRTQPSESLNHTRATSRPVTSQQMRPTPSTTSSSGSARAHRTRRPAELRRTTVRPPTPSRSPPAYATLPPGSNASPRAPSDVAVCDVALEASNGRTAHPQRPPHFAAPAAPSPQTVVYMEGCGTRPPTYISPSKFFAEHGEEHGLERPPAYVTTAPTQPAAAHWIPRDRIGEDWHDMAMEGRRDMIGVRRTDNPDSIPRAQNGVGGGDAERN